MRREIYFKTIKNSDDPYVLINKDDQTRTVRLQYPLRRAIIEHIRGRARYGNAPVKGINALFLIIDVDIKKKVGDTYIIDKDLKQKLWEKDVKYFDNVFGPGRWAAFESKSGGAHIYVPLENIEVSEAYRCGTFIRNELTDYHVDIFPTPGGRIGFGARVFWEYYENKDNCRIPLASPQPLNREQFAMISHALRYRGNDQTRSGRDFALSHAAVWALKAAPYNAGKCLSADYVARTLSKAMPRYFNPVHIEEISEVNLKKLFSIGNIPIYQSEIVTLHGQPGVGKTTTIIKYMPQNSIYISTEISPYIFKKIAKKFRKKMDIFYAESHLPADVLEYINVSTHQAYVVDTVQYLGFSDFKDQQAFLSECKIIANRDKKVIVFVAHQNRGEARGMQKIWYFSSLMHLSTKVIHKTPDGFVVEKNSYEGIEDILK